MDLVVHSIVNQRKFQWLLNTPFVLGNGVGPSLCHFLLGHRILSMMLFEGDDQLRREALIDVLGRLENQPIWGWAAPQAEDFDHNPVSGKRTMWPVGFE